MNLVLMGVQRGNKILASNFSFPAAPPPLPLKLMTGPLDDCDEIWILYSSGKNNIVDE
jgi:hypothetical protein